MRHEAPFRFHEKHGLREYRLRSWAVLLVQIGKHCWCLQLCFCGPRAWKLRVVKLWRLITRRAASELYDTPVRTSQGFLPPRGQVERNCNSHALELHGCSLERLENSPTWTSTSTTLGLQRLVRQLAFVRHCIPGREQCSGAKGQRKFQGLGMARRSMTARSTDNTAKWSPQMC